MICYNTVQIIMTQHIAYGFILKLKQTGFNNAIENTAKFKSFKYKAKSLRPTVPQSIWDQANAILTSAQIFVIKIDYLQSWIKT